VNLKRKIRTVLREKYGSVETYLDMKYFNTMTDNLLIEEPIHKKNWVTYNQVILELKNNLQDSLKVKELQYRLTDNENPQKACISVLETVKSRTPELERLYNKIRNF
jgi:hypothetical protein